MGKHLRDLVKQFEDKRLAMFIVCCHVDKLLAEDIPNSKYDIPIQAGAELTDVRVCELNDMTDLPDNISERNQRYSEMTAMYWAWKNIETDYVGICHYRRRLLITDDEMKKYLDDGFDIISVVPCEIRGKVKENYLDSYYVWDWNLFERILEEKAPKYFELAKTCFEENTIHPANLGIFSKEMYQEYCEFAFPILEEFYQQSPWKFDTYQRRDVGFIGERLTSLFVDMKKKEGKKVIEVGFKDFRSKEWTAEQECDLTDFDAVYEACKKYYANFNITRCRNLVAGALKNGGVSDERIKKLALLFKAALSEQKELPLTMYEYLPDEWSKDLETLVATFDALGTILNVMRNDMISENTGGITEKAKNMFLEFIRATRFSEIAIDCQMHNLGISDESIIRGIKNIL